MNGELGALSKFRAILLLSSCPTSKYPGRPMQTGWGGHLLSSPVSPSMAAEPPDPFWSRASVLALLDEPLEISACPTKLALAALFV